MKIHDQLVQAFFYDIDARLENQRVVGSNTFLHKERHGYRFEYLEQVPSEIAFDMLFRHGLSQERETEFSLIGHRYPGSRIRAFHRVTYLCHRQNHAYPGTFAPGAWRSEHDIRFYSRLFNSYIT